MGLDTYDQDTPIGTSSLAQGDNKVRELAQKTCASVEEEHNLNGKHNFPHGSLGQRPAAGNAGRIYIVDDPVAGTVYIQYDNGTAWSTLVSVSSSGLTVDQVDAALDTHAAATPIDHPSLSVTEAKLAAGAVTNAKIGNGALRRVHFDSADSDPQGAVSSLVDGSEIGASFHTHAAGAGASGITFLANIATVANGAGSTSWTNLDLSSSGVPDSAIGVILQGVGSFTLDCTIAQDKTPAIDVRKSSSDDTIHLIGSKLSHGILIGSVTLMEDRGQAMSPVNTGATIQYKSEGYNSSWTIKLIGYIE